MACNVCDHTMESIVDGVFWCPRCGAYKKGTETHRPKLIERCRAFEAEMRAKLGYAVADWVTLGIAESIDRPGGRPKDS